jgi:hypothetical protein
MDWFKQRKAVREYVVKIKTPSGYGSGFLVAYNKSGGLMAIATAAHVLADAEEWHLPLKLIPEASGEEAFLNYEQRVIYMDRSRDSAYIVVPSNTVALPKTTLPLVPKDQFILPGAELGWLGYPSLAPNELCFFQGYASAFVGRGEDYYLIDGVAVNGVSGGPVFEPEKEPNLVGLVSAYYSNREVLPGLLKAYDLTHAHAAIEGFKNFDDAREKAQVQNEADAIPAKGPSQGTASGAASGA